MISSSCVGTPQSGSGPKRIRSQLDRNSGGMSTIITPNTAVLVCRVRSERRASFSSAAYQPNVNSAYRNSCAGNCDSSASAAAVVGSGRQLMR